MKLGKTVKLILLGLCAVFVLAGIAIPTYLYVKEKENSRRQALSASFQTAFGNNIAVINYEELTTVPVVLFKAKGEDGKDYIVLAGEFGSAWVVLNKREITQPAVPTP